MPHVLEVQGMAAEDYQEIWALFERSDLKMMSLFLLRRRWFVTFATEEMAERAITQIPDQNERFTLKKIGAQRDVEMLRHIVWTPEKVTKLVWTVSFAFCWALSIESGLGM